MMNTKSVCHECAADVPATLSLNDANEVMMTKRCVLHGESTTTVEKDPALYQFLRESTAPIYPGHFIDVTDRCPLTCGYCYYPCNSKRPDPTIDAIVAEAVSSPLPTYLTGGEPTTRKDLPEIFGRLRDHAGGAGMPTNGIGLLDTDYLKAILKVCGRYVDPLASATAHPTAAIARISLSYHVGQNEKAFAAVIDSLRSMGERIAGPIFVINTLDDLPSVLAIAKSVADVCHTARIHVATDIWNGHGTTIYMSELLREVERLAAANSKHFLWFPSASRLMWVRAWYDGIPLALIRWQTKHDMDLWACDCAPTYRARNGEICHLTHGWIINEAMHRGWLKGKQLYADI